MKSILKSIWNAIKSHPHICVIFLTALLITVLGIPFYYFFVIIGIYFIAMYLIHLPTYAGNTGYFLERLTGRRKPALPWYRFAYRQRTKSEYALVSYGLYLLEECQYEEALHLFQYLFTLPSIEPTVKKFAYQDLSIAQWKCGDLPGAIATLEQMLNILIFLFILRSASTISKRATTKRPASIRIRRWKWMRHTDRPMTTWGSWPSVRKTMTRRRPCSARRWT